MLSMKKFALVSIAALAMGCAQVEVAKVREWAEPAKAQAKAGQMKWSDYYKGLYSRIAALPEMDGKAFYLNASNLLIDAAIAKENGQISTDQFESFQRKMTAAESEYAEQVRAQRATAAAAAYSNFLQYQALQVRSWQANQPINCTAVRSGAVTNTNCR